MKRSNRLLIMAGVLLAAVAFAAVLLLGGGGGPPAEPPQVTVVAAATDIEVGTPLTAEMLTTVQRPPEQATETYAAPEDVVGQVVRRRVTNGQVLRTTDFQSAEQPVEIVSSIPAGMRAVAVPLDKLTSVGFLVQPGDYVDVMLAVRDEQGLNEQYSDGDGLNPVIGPSVDDPNIYENKDALLNNTTVKVLVQNVQVLTILRPAAPTDPGAARAQSLDPDMVAVLAVSPQEAELVRFAMLDGNISLLLRAPGDSQAEDVATTGVTLRLLVDSYGVLPPGPVTIGPIVPYQPLP